MAELTTDKPSPEDEAKVDVLQKIDFVCRRIVQGQHAIDCWEMKYYRVHTALTVILSTLGSAGLVKKQYDLSQLPDTGMSPADWVVFLVAISALAAAIILELYRAFGIDKKALQAISACDSFSRLLKALENALECKDPRFDLNQVVLDAKTLGTNFHDVLNDPPAQDVDRLKEKLVNQFQKNWVFQATERKGKSR